MSKERKSLISEDIFQKVFTRNLSKGEATQLKIINTAVKVLGEKGLNEFSLDLVSKELGTRRSHLVYYFKSTTELLESLFKGIIQTAEDYTVEELSEKLSPLEMLDGVTEGAARWMHEKPLQMRCLISLFELAGRNNRFKKLNDTIRSGGLARLSEIIKKMHPHFSKEKILIRSRSIQSQITGELINYFTTYTDQNFEEFIVALKGTCRIIAKEKN